MRKNAALRVLAFAREGLNGTLDGHTRGSSQLATRAESLRRIACFGRTTSYSYSSRATSDGEEPPVRSPATSTKPPLPPSRPLATRDEYKRVQTDRSGKQSQERKRWDEPLARQPSKSGTSALHNSFNNSIRNIRDFGMLKGCATVVKCA